MRCSNLNVPESLNLNRRSDREFISLDKSHCQLIKLSETRQNPAKVTSDLPDPAETILDTSASVKVNSVGINNPRSSRP